MLKRKKQHFICIWCDWYIEYNKESCLKATRISEFSKVREYKIKIEKSILFL